MADSVDIEKSVIASLLLAAYDQKSAERVMGAYERKGISEDWFRNPVWKKLWQAVKAEWDEHRSVDQILVANRYGEDGVKTVAAAIDGEATSSYAEYYADVFRDRHLMRMVHALCMDTVAKIGENTGPHPAIQKLAEGLREIQGVAAIADGGITKVADYRDELIERYTWLHEERVVKGNRRAWIGLPFMWEIGNTKYQGIRSGLHVIAALPSQGKTVMGVMLSKFWCEQHIKHGFFCIDMDAAGLVERYGCLSRQVSLSKLATYGSAEDLSRFKEGITDAELDEYVDISESCDIERVRDQVYRGVYTHGWRAVIIDYLQLLEDPSKKNMATYEMVKAVTLAVKRLSKEVGVPFICLVQLSRQFEKDNRADGRMPGLSDLGDSAEIARAARTVAMLVVDQNTKKLWEEHPPMKLAYQVEDERGVVQEAGQARLAASLRPVWYHIAKNQQGPTGDIPMVMYPSYFLFRCGDWERETVIAEIGGKDRKCEVEKFEHLRDDWLVCDGDEIYERNGVMGVRGVVYGNEKMVQRNLGV